MKSGLAHLRDDVAPRRGRLCSPPVEMLEVPAPLTRVEVERRQRLAGVDLVASIHRAVEVGYLSADVGRDLLDGLPGGLVLGGLDE